MEDQEKKEHAELFQLLMKFYHVFYEILRTGNPMEKAFALRSFDSVNRQIREKVGEYEELHQIHFDDVEPLISSDKEVFGSEVIEMKESLLEMREKTKPLIEKAEVDLGISKGSKRRGRRMKKNIRARNE